VGRLPGVVLRDAQLELRLRGLPLGRRVEVVRDGDVEAAVAVVVEERGADGEERILEARVAPLLEPPVAATKRPMRGTNLSPRPPPEASPAFEACMRAVRIAA